MKKKIKLKDMTTEQWDKNRISLCKLNMHENCDSCIFKGVNCGESFFRNSWIHHKDLYSDKFLNQEIEINTDILDEEEKEYLSAVLKPFKNKVISIKKLIYDTIFVGSDYHPTYSINIQVKNKFSGFGIQNIQLPFFQNDMYKGMEVDKEYTLEELGLFQENTKITLTEFWNSKEKLAIHCDTKEKAKQLLKAFDKMGKKWSAGDSYLEYIYWSPYKQNTCYNNNNGYCSIDWCKEEDYKVYKFENVDFEELKK